MSSFEKLIGEALLGNNANKALAMARVDCKHYAMKKMFCDCGSVLDQTGTNILRDENGKDKAVCCNVCRGKAIEAISRVADPSGLIGWQFVNWTGLQPVLRNNSIQDN